MTSAHTRHPLEGRIHDGVMQLLGTALLKTEMCEKLQELGRQADVSASLVELRSALVDSIGELRSIMADLRASAANPESIDPRAA